MRTTAVHPDLAAQPKEKPSQELETPRIELTAQFQSLSGAMAELAAMRDAYADLYQHAPVGYLMLDDTAGIRKANHRAALMLGRDPSRLTGLSFFILVEKSDRLLLTRFMTELRVRSDRTVETDVALDHAPLLYVHLIGQAHAPSTVAPGTFRVVMVDITRQRLVEETLRRSERHLKTTAAAWHLLMSDTAELSGLVGRDGKILCASRALHTLLGYADRELEGRDVRMLSAPEDPWESNIPVRSFLASPSTPTHALVRLLHKTADSRWYGVAVKLVSVGEDKAFLVHVTPARP